MGGLIVPYFAQAQTASVVIDGVTYRVPLIDSGGRVYTNAYATGASEVKGAMKVTVSDSTTRATVVAPTSGKKIRLLSCLAVNSSSIATRVEVYFGTGANISVDTTKAIMTPRLLTTQDPNLAMAWPDGAGPVGAVDEVVSMRTAADVVLGGYVVVHYREE